MLHRAIDEEVGGEIVHIFNTIMNVIVFISKELQRDASKHQSAVSNPSTAGVADQRAMSVGSPNAQAASGADAYKQLNAIVDKALSVAELISCSGGNKSALRERISGDHNDCLKHVLEALNWVELLDRQLTLVRILKALIVNENHLLQVD